MAKTNELTELNEYVGLKLDHVQPYLFALGYEYYEGNYRYRKFFNNYKSGRCIVLDLSDDKTQRIECFKQLTKCYQR